MGTESGRALVYDLKKPKEVKLELKGHEGKRRVNALQFTKVYKPGQSSSNSQPPTQQAQSVKSQAVVEESKQQKSPVINT